MGLFRKDNPALKKLKELTGGFRLSSDYKDLLKENGISTRDGIKIQQQLKEEINKENLSESDVEERLYTLINEMSNKEIKTCPNCSKSQDGTNAFCIECGYNFNQKSIKISDDNLDEFKDVESSEEIIEITEEKIAEFHKIDYPRKFAFLNTFDFNLKTCPDCNTKFLKADLFCFNCGASVLTQDTVKNDNLEIHDGKLTNQSKSGSNELSDLESLYNQTIQSKYSPNFRIAYVLYLENLRKNPSKKFSEKIAKKYETTISKLKKQALEDDFIELASPLAAASDFKVNELKDILRNHNLKVSGKKDELIKRLGDNLSDTELKKYFKSKNYQISPMGLEFLSNNNYVLYIQSDKDIANVFYPSEIFKIFSDESYTQNEVQDKLLVYLKRVFDDKLNQELWVDFKIYSNAIAQVQEDIGDLEGALNTRFKVFIFNINNYSIVLNRPDPRKTNLKQKDLTIMV